MLLFFFCECKLLTTQPMLMPGPITPFTMLLHIQLSHTSVQRKSGTQKEACSWHGRHFLCTTVWPSESYACALVWYPCLHMLIKKSGKKKHTHTHTWTSFFSNFQGIEAWTSIINKPSTSYSFQPPTQVSPVHPQHPTLPKVYPWPFSFAPRERAAMAENPVSSSPRGPAVLVLAALPRVPGCPSGGQNNRWYYD